MQSVLAHIHARRAALAAHPFLVELAQKPSLRELLGFAPRLAGWVAAFQDLLRVNAEHARDAELRSLLLTHTTEEGGHDQWYFEDLELLTKGFAVGGGSSPSSSAAIRDATFDLIFEARTLREDILRIVLLLALEATSDVFFHHVAPLVAARGGAHLKYFSEHHVRVEEAHSVFEARLEEKIRSRELTPDVRAQAIALVDRTFAAFDRMFHGLRNAPALPLPDAGERQARIVS